MDIQTDTYAHKGSGQMKLDESKLGICAYFLYNNSVIWYFYLKLMLFSLYQIFKMLIIPHIGRHLRF